jgi:hypothetical protein
MSFSIKCNNCGREMIIKDKAAYLSTPIDFMVEEDKFSGDQLEIFCNNKLCKNEVRITV